ncbi:MAG TPA: metallophosphoesterase [Patescibacteria group bacterium]
MTRLFIVLILLGAVGYLAVIGFDGNRNQVSDKSDQAGKDLDFEIDNNYPKIVAVGDIACNDTKATATCFQSETANLAKSLNPDAVLVLGDLQYEEGELTNFQKYYDSTWGELKSITRPAVGNHEYGRTENAPGYFDYFNGVGILDGPAGKRGEGYYSFDQGNWHIVAINSNCQFINCSKGSKQLLWLQDDLAKTEKSCILAYWHSPRFSSGLHGDDLEMEAIWQTLAQYGADLVLSGHDHHYERFAKQNGIRQFIAGTGGRSLYQIKELEPNSEIVNALTYGVLELTLKENSYDFRFLPVEGQTFKDSGSANCNTK